jgi:hypothetical protein
MHKILYDAAAEDGDTTLFKQVKNSLRPDKADSSPRCVNCNPERNVLEFGNMRGERQIREYALRTSYMIPRKRTYKDLRVTSVKLL